MSFARTRRPELAGFSDDSLKHSWWALKGARRKHGRPIEPEVYAAYRTEYKTRGIPLPEELKPRRWRVLYGVD